MAMARAGHSSDLRERDPPDENYTKREGCEGKEARAGSAVFRDSIYIKLHGL